MKRIVLLVETSRAFGRELIIGIARYARLHGPWTFYKEPIDLKSSIPLLNSWKPDGIIMRDSLITKELLKLNIPALLVVHDSSYPKELPSIKTESALISKMASDHLLGKGLKNFAYCGFSDYDWSEERKFHFVNNIKKAGFQTHIYNPPPNVKGNEWEKEQRHVIQWVKSLPKPIGIFTCNDDRGQHILEVCKISGFNIPGDVAVLGVDNDPIICEIGDPPLSSIALNIQAAGYEAAKQLDQMIRNKKVKGKKIPVYPTHVVQRQSSDVLAINDPEVTAAIVYIKENAKEKILINDVVKATSVSRRTLENRFKKYLHSSIYDEIRRVRIELISRLLLETDMPISQITAMFNFTDFEHISRYFKKEKGTGLREFRKIHQPH